MIQKGYTWMDRIAVLIHCYNEAQTIAGVVRDIHEALPEAVVYVYDNNSTDKTADLAREQGAVVRYEHRQGKGNVIRRMFREIDAECYLMIDGDDTYPLDCARKMTVQEAFLAQAGIRLLALAVAVILIYAVAMAVKNAVAGMAAAVLVFAAEYVLDILIPVSGTLNYFKCMNLFFCWDMKNTFGTYCNLNIFGFPVGKGCCAAAAAAVVCVLAACMGAVFYARTCQITAEGWVAALLGMLREKCAFLTRHTSILFYELYKVFVQQKKWIAFVTLLIWCMYESHTALVPDILTSMPDASYYNYMRQLSGRVTEEKLAWMEAEGERLADLVPVCRIDLLDQTGLHKLIPWKRPGLPSGMGMSIRKGTIMSCKCGYAANMRRNPAALCIWRIR